MSKLSIIPNERILKQIIVLRDEKVMLDVHLAELYKVETRALKQSVKRNIERFPKDIMFKLTKKEIDTVVSQNVIPHKKYFGGATPLAFTETGVAMLSSVLSSKKAIETNLAVMRTFVALRKIALNYKEIMEKLEQMEKGYDKKFTEIFTALKYLLNPAQSTRRRIGYKTSSRN